MAKRYHQSKRARMHEERGEERHLRGPVKHHSMRMKHGLGDEYYAGKDPRRRLEHEDGMMISEDHNAVANLPQEVRYHEWGAQRHYARFELDDTMRGIDHQEDEDGSGMMRHLQPGKY